MFSCKLTKPQGVVVILTWVAYASTYLLRKPIGVVKNDIADDFGLSKTQLGYLDAALLLPYALVQIMFSSTADKFGVRSTLGFSLLVAALSMVSFGKLHNYLLMLGLMLVNGAAQSLAWPSCVKALGDWFTSDQLSILFGPWGTCTFAGGVLGSAVAVYLQASHPWRITFLIPSLFVGYVAVLVLIFMPNSTHPGLPLSVKETRNSSYKKQSWLDLWRIGLVKEAAIATFCLKIVRYCMYMWLPMYLHQQLQYSQMEAGLVATIFEVGAVIGSVSLSIVLNKVFAGHLIRGTTVTVFISAFSFVAFYMSSSYGHIANMICIFLAGLTNGGADPILTGIVPTTLAERSQRNGKAAISGLINGFGSVGTILEGPIIGFAAEFFGWSSMLYLMVALSLCGGFILQRGEKYWDGGKRGTHII